jgi:hypothetical protein
MAKLHQMQLNLRDMSLPDHRDWYYKSVPSEFDATDKNLFTNQTFNFKNRSKKVSPFMSRFYSLKDNFRNLKNNVGSLYWPNNITVSF